MFIIYNLYNLGLSLLFFLISFGVGKKILNRFKFSFKSLLENWLFSTGLGLGLIGILIFVIGSVSLLYKPVIWGLTAVLLIWTFGEIWTFLKSIPYRKIKLPKNVFGLFIALGFVFLVFYYLMGALGPEKNFDALWYHLTEPKLYLQNHQIRFINWGWFNLTSAFPRLVESLYVWGMAFTKTETIAKLIHFSFGIMATLTIYAIGKRFFQPKIGLLASLMFYSLAGVGFASQTAYVDLAAAFFCLMTFLAFYCWLEKSKDKKWLIISAVFLGFWYGVKIYGVITLSILSFLILWQKEPRLKNFLIFAGTFLIISSPWWLAALIQTGNPIYPILSVSPDWEHAEAGTSMVNWFLSGAVKTLPALIWRTLTQEIAFLALIIPALFYWKKMPALVKTTLIVTVLWFWGWSFIPVRDPRYFMAAAGLGLLVVAWFVFEIKNGYLKWTAWIVLILILYSNLLLQKQNSLLFWPVFFGQEKRADFIARVVEPDPWQFYDSKHFVRQNLPTGQKALVFNVFCPFYIDFPYFDAFQLKNQIGAVNSQELKKELKKQNINFVVMKTTATFITNEPNFHGLLKMILKNENNRDKILADPNFSQDFTKVYEQTFSAGGWQVYKIN